MVLRRRESGSEMSPSKLTFLCLFSNKARPVEFVSLFVEEATFYKGLHSVEMVQKLSPPPIGEP